MNSDIVFWVVIYSLHVLILIQLVVSWKFARIPLFTALIAQQVLQTPILWFVYYHISPHYFYAYTIGKTFDVVFTFLAIGELLCDRTYRGIGYTLEAYLMAQMIMEYVLAQHFNDYWHDMESRFKPVYIVFEIVWFMIIWKGGKNGRTAS